MHPADDPNQSSKFDHWLTPESLTQFHFVLSDLESRLDKVTDYEAFVLLARRFNPLYPAFLEGPITDLESRVLNQWDAIVSQPTTTQLVHMRQSVRGACRHISQLELFSVTMNRDDWQRKRLGLRIYNAGTDPVIKHYLVRGDAIGRLETHEAFWIITFLFAVAGYRPPVSELKIMSPGVFYRPYYSPYTIITEIKNNKPHYLPRNPMRRFCTHLSDLCHHFRKNRFDDNSYLQPITENIRVQKTAQPPGKEDPPAPNRHLHFSPEDIKVRAKLGTDDENHPVETTLCYFASKIHALSELPQVECISVFDSLVLTHLSGPRAR